MAAIIYNAKKTISFPWYMLAYFECMHCEAVIQITSPDEGEYQGRYFIGPFCPVCARRTIYPIPENNGKEITLGTVIKPLGGQ